MKTAQTDYKNQSPTSGERLIELEAIRGLATCVVLFNHLLVAFHPALHGLRSWQLSFALFGTPLFAFVNGTAAVILFFVLSGFVLTIRSFQEKNYGDLVIGALKRWPRLVVPVLAVNIVSGALSGLGLYTNKKAASDLGSVWLGAFFNEKLEFWASVRAAAIEGSYLTFFASHDYFNSNLWTMYYEFMGSFACFGIAAAMILIPRFAWLIVGSATIIAFSLFDPYFACFPAGTCLAYFHTQPSWKRSALWFSSHRFTVTATLSAIIVLLFAYHGTPAGLPALYAPLRALHAWAPEHVQISMHVIGSTLVLTLVLIHPALATHLRSPFGAMLGRYSFPIYLVQVPVICSIGAGVYVFLSPWTRQSVALVLAFLSSFVSTIIFAIPITKLEEQWLSVLHRTVTGFRKAQEIRKTTKAREI